MEEKVRKVTDDFVKCDICTEVCRQPSTLSCQHTFCQGCLTRYIKTQTDAVKTRCIPCPTCGQQTPVPHLDIPVEENTEADHCSICKKEGKTTPATHDCSDCKVYFCDGCLKLNRQMPKSLHQSSIKETNSTNLSQLERKKYVSKQHNESVKLICKNSRKALGFVSCTGDHRSCHDEDTLQTMMPEVKQDLQNRQMKLTRGVKNKSEKVAALKNKMKTLLSQTSELKLEIKDVIKSVVNLLHQKEDKMMKRLDDITERKTGQLQARVEFEELEIQMYQQQSQFIQQTLEKEDETQMFEAYFSGSEAVTYVTEIRGDNLKDEAEISFIHDLEKLKEEIDKMHVETDDDVIDLAASPVLHEIIDTNLDEIDKCNVTDVVRIQIEDIKVTVVTDSNKAVKSFYTQNGERLSSQLKVKTCPWSLSVLSPNKVVVSVPRSNQILTFGVNPDLQLLSSLTTKKQYSGLAVLDQSTLVASCPSPPSVDVLDMAGHVLRCISARPLKQQLFKNPQYLHVTSQGNILVSDYTAHSLVCVTQTGQVVFTYSPTESALGTPRGITSTQTGDIFIANSCSNSVIQLSNSGQFVRHILTSQHGLECPRGVCIDGNRLCVATRHKGVHVFQVL